MRRTPDRTAILGGPDTVRYSWLLVALVVSFALPPLLQATDIGVPSLRLGLAGVLLASLYAVSRQPWILWLGLALASTTLVLDWASVALHSRNLALATTLPAIAFLGLVVMAMGKALMAAQRVTTETILGGICVYLLLGLLWVSAFTLVEIVQPGSLLLAGAPLEHEVAAQQEPFRHAEIFYFSFVTLTTVGYGDVTPATSAARALAAGEAVVGQLYVAVFVARLVGLHLAHSRA